MAQRSDRLSSAFSLKPLMFETCVCTLAMMSFVALIGSIARVLGMAPWQAGMAVTVSGLAWMLLARFWGAASDRHGRRRVLLSGLSGFVLTYAGLCAFIAIALMQHIPTWWSFVGIVILRGMTGGFYAAVPATAAALIADHVEPHQRAGAMAGLGAASGVGMVAGPGIAGLLAVYDLAWPLYLTAVLPIVALLVLWHWLPHTEHHVRPDTTRLRISDRRLRHPMTVAFISMLSVMVAQVVVGFFALDRLGLDAAAAARVAGIALTVVGVAIILAQILVHKLNWPPQRLIRIGSMTAAVGFASLLFATTQEALWGAYFVAAAGMGWVFPAVTAWAANSVQAHEQGATAGTVSAAQGLGMVVGPLAGTLIYHTDPAAPYVLIAALLLLTALWPMTATEVAADVQGAA